MPLLPLRRLRLTGARSRARRPAALCAGSCLGRPKQWLALPAVAGWQQQRAAHLRAAIGFDERGGERGAGERVVGGRRQVLPQESCCSSVIRGFVALYSLCKNWRRHFSCRPMIWGGFKGVRRSQKQGFIFNKPVESAATENEHHCDAGPRSSAPKDLRCVCIGPAPCPRRNALQG